MRILTTAARVTRAAAIAALLVALVSCGFRIPVLFPGPPDDMEMSDATCNRPPNGCSPVGFFGLEIPECPAFPACFRPACNDHDNCYRRCGIDKTLCDNVFLMDMQDACNAAFGYSDSRQERCYSLAFVYASAVDRYGNEIFAGVQAIGCACGEIGVIYTRDGAALPLKAEASRLHSPPFPDADDDLLPDDWEISVGLDPFDPTDVTRDDDGDGLNSVAEFIFDTDPFVYSPRE